ncbi:MAG: hypothetical protein IT374_24840 [Polyangiaceae bacterium]|nr:hypothetical protein [Polyangiaceae bacterium]
MLHEDVRFEGWDVRDWQRLVSALRRPASARPPGEPSGGLFVLHDGARVHKLLHSTAGRLPGAGGPARPLAELCAEHHARWGVSLHEGALEELMERVSARARRGDDLVDQALGLLSIAQRMGREGALGTHPTSLASLRVPPADVLRGAVSRLLPDGKVLALGLFEGGELFTAIALRRRGRAIDLVLGPEELRARVGLLSGDFRRDYRFLVAAIEELAGPIGTGVFTDVATFRELFVSPPPGAWARAALVRDVVVVPLSGAALVPIAIDAARGLFAALVRAGERLDPTGRVALLTAGPPAPRAASVLSSLRARWFSR